MITHYYNDRKITSRGFFGNNYKDNFIKIKVIAETRMRENGNYFTSYLIELPDKRRIAVKEKDIYESPEGIN